MRAWGKEVETMWKILALVTAVALASCSLDEPQTAAELGSVDAESEALALDDEYVLAASDCLTEDDCEYYPEQTYAQCVASCQGGVAAIERFCWLIRIPWVQASCLAMRFGGPVVCANWCYWYFTPH
jgi:hypothetical protein